MTIVCDVMGCHNASQSTSRRYAVSWARTIALRDYRVGVARGYRRVLKAARKASPEVIQKAIEFMRDDAAPWQARLNAVEIVLDRGWRTDPETDVDRDSVGSIPSTSFVMIARRSPNRSVSRRGGSKARHTTKRRYRSRLIRHIGQRLPDQRAVHEVGQLVAAHRGASACAATDRTFHP
jgi:hypothetical protein